MLMGGTALSGITILGGFLITSAQAEPKEGWGVHLEGNQITLVGPNESLPQQNTRVIDARDKIVCPGLINTHHHMYGYLAHGIAVPAIPQDFYGFLTDFWWPLVENRLDHRLIAAASAWAAVEMIHSGITTFSDILEAPAAIPGALHVEAEIIQAAGLRGFLSFEATERVSALNGRLGIQENTEFIRWARERKSLVQGMMCTHTTFTCSPDFLREARRQADELGVFLQFHLSESDFEPRYTLENYRSLPVNFYEQIGFLNERTLASQCVQVQPAEVQILAQYGVKASHMPLSNCEVGGGIAPIPDLLAAGLDVGLGTDGYINNFFEVMRGAFLFHKAYRRNPALLPARQVLEMATEMGARSLGLEQLGRLEPGYFADLILIEADFPTPLRSHNLFDQLILHRNPEHVDTVIVDGQIIMQDKNILTLNEKEAREELLQAAQTFWR